MIDDKKFNIRITFHSKEQQIVEQEIPPESDYIYHWPRIIITLLATITLFCTSCYYFYNSADQSKVVLQSTEIKREKPTFKKTVDAINEAINNNPKRLVMNTPEIPSAHEIMVATPVTAAVHPLSNKINLSTANQQVQKNKQSALLTQSDIRIFSPKISRFVLTNAITDKEPVGTIGDIKFDQNNIATVYAYSDARGFTDQFLYYKWRLNGKLIANVKVGVWGDHWRSYSTKFIQPHMLGDWSVTLENQAGEILALNQFKY